jgi:SNF2 family DNA or RNA helicase
LSRLIVELAGEVATIATPAGVKATLRGYQSRGLSWLFHRTRLGLGALLADDMGLGKTVQLIALLIALKNLAESTGDESAQTTLLICPASLVGNWEHELQRFAPSLRVVRHHGSARHKDAGDLQAKTRPHDVVLTTYGLVRRDVDLLSRITWGIVVCDEAQNIKNAMAAQARAVRTLSARRKVALTGTPVENRLTELWGLMEFLNPGLLGTLDRFRR